MRTSWMSCTLIAIAACGVDEQADSLTLGETGVAVEVGSSDGYADGDETGDGDGEPGDGQPGDGQPEDDIKFDLAPLTDTSTQACEGGDGPLFSYIYISNTEQSTLSKLNTQTMIEEGRYTTRPDGNGSPSRTSVNLSGDVAVANRNGGITKVYAQITDCKDSNGIAGIQTSSGKDDILMWGVEECRAWYRPFPQYNSQRPVAWTAGELDKKSCKFVEQKLWSSGTNGATIDVVRLDGDTGQIEATVPIAGVAPGLFGAYGGVVDSEDGFWFMTYASGFPLVHVWEDLTYEIHWAPIEIHPYGITIDHAGRIWIASDSGGTGRFDPVTQLWKQLPGVTGLGIQEHPDGYMWMGTWPALGVQAIDVETMALGPFLSLPEATEQTKGVSIDFYGYVWVVDMGQSAFRIDPDTLQYDIYDKLTKPYTYSDMTGWGLSNVSNPEG